MVDIPDLPLDELEEATGEPESSDSGVADESGGSIVYGVLGAGQAGGRICESFYNLGYKKAIAVNTAKHDLNGLSSLPEEHKVLMSSESGGGAGKNMKVGEQIADKHKQEVYEKMQAIFGEVDRILVCVGGGGGTGGGSSLVMREVAVKYLTYLGVSDPASRVGFILTLPKAGEAASPDVAENAHKVATALCKLAESNEISPLIIFDNDKIDKMYPNLPVKKFWPTVNATVTGLFHMFNVITTQDGISSFDPADYERVIGAGGCMIMGLTSLKEYSSGTHVSTAIRQNTEKGLLCGGFDISTAKAAACIATAPSEVLETVPGLMASLDSGFDTLANLTGNAVMFRGIYEVEKPKFVIYTMVTGLSTPTERLKELKRFEEKKEKKKGLYK